MRGRALGVLVGLLAASPALVAIPAAHAANWTSSQIITAVNAERSANGLPAGLLENSTYTQDCAAHDAYAQANGGFDPGNAHGETKSNATQAGITGGSHSVLADGARWSAGDPWESAPYHLLQVMNPRLLSTGADESGTDPFDCLWTIPPSTSDERPAASTDTLYSFPGNGRTDVPWFEFTDSEYPSSPNDTLGIPRSQATGFDIQVYWDGPGTDLGYLCQASITGPGGTVASQIINNAKTQSVGTDAGLIVPTSPLEPSTQYSVSATFSDTAPTCDSAHEFSHSFSFTTAAKQAASDMMHVDDKTVDSGGDWTIPFHVDQPLARGTGTVSVSSSGYLTPGTYQIWPSGSLQVPPPPSGQWVKVTLQNDPYSIGSTSWSSTSVSRTFTASDTTAPTITIDTPADGAHYTQGQAVDASYSCADESGGSGVASCTGPVASGAAIDTSSTGQHSFEVDAADNAGNKSTKTVAYTVDAPSPGPPTITIDSPTDGTHYAQGAAVAASYTCKAQGQYTIDSCTGPVPSGNDIDTGAVGQHSFTVDATDNAEQQSSKTVHYTIDAPPTVTIDTTLAPFSGSADQTFSFHSDTAGATFKCSLDSASATSCSSGTAYGGLTDGYHTFTVQAVGPSGGAGDPQSVSWTVDTTPPKLELDNPVDGGHYVQRQAGNAIYFCGDDGGSGVADCSGTAPQMQPLDDSLGTHTFTATATDKAGNRTSRTVTYYVDAKVLQPGDVVSGTQPGGGGGGSNSHNAPSSLSGNGGRAQADAHGRFAVPGAQATCGAGPCTVSAVATGQLPSHRRVAAARSKKKNAPKALTLGSWRTTLQSGQSGAIYVTLTPAARAALAHGGSLRLTVTLSITDAAGSRWTRTVSVTVTAPARHSKHRKR